MKHTTLSSKDIGLKIKWLREERKLSMRDLASTADVSASFISKVEAGKVSPTVMSLQKLLEAMNVDLFEFFLEKKDIDASEQVIFKKSRMAVLEDEEHAWYYAFPKHPNIKVELTYEEYKPHTTLIEKEIHKGDIFGYVVSGELTLNVEKKGVFKAKAGDAFYLKAGEEHTATNEGDKLLKLVAGQIK